MHNNYRATLNQFQDDLQLVMWHYTGVVSRSNASQYVAAINLIQSDTKALTESKYANEGECIDQYDKH